MRQYLDSIAAKTIGKQQCPAEQVRCFVRCVAGPPGAVIYDGYDIYDDSDPIPYGAAVEQWCDLRLKQPVMLEAGKRYELVVTCSEKGNTGGDEHGAFFGEEGAETVEGGDGLTLRFHGSERDENDTEDTRGQIAHLIYSLA